MLDNTLITRVSQLNTYVWGRTLLKFQYDPDVILTVTKYTDKEYSNIDIIFALFFSK